MTALPPSSLLAASEGIPVRAEYNVITTLVTNRTRAGAAGVAVGRFAWVTPTGVVNSFRSSAADLQGLVMPVDLSRSGAVYFDDVTGSWRIRPGLPVTLYAQGNVWAWFPYGAQMGQQVYANPLDGSAFSGYSPACELTQWSVNSPAAAGALAIISTWSKPAP